MSQTSLSFLSSEAGDDTEADARPASRTRVLVLGSVLVLALAGGGYSLLSGGEDEALVDASTSVVAAPRASASPEAAVPSATAAPAAARAGVGRDPFQVPNAVAATAGSAPAAAGTAVPAGTVEAPVGTSVPGPDTASADVPIPAADEPLAVPAPPASEGSGTGASVPVATSRRLALVRVAGTADARTAVLTLDGVPVTVAVGSSFGASSDLRLLSVQEGPEDGQWTAVVQAGAEEPFDVVTGSPVTVL